MGTSGVGTVPEVEKNFVGSECPDAGGIGIRPMRGGGACKVLPGLPPGALTRRPAIPDDAAVVEDFLKLLRGDDASTDHEELCRTIS
jgi:hypothetical protein